MVSVSRYQVSCCKGVEIERVKYAFRPIDLYFVKNKIYTVSAVGYVNVQNLSK